MTSERVGSRCTSSGTTSDASSVPTRKTTSEPPIPSLMKRACAAAQPSVFERRAACGAEQAEGLPA